MTIKRLNPIKRTKPTMLADFNFLAVSILVAGDLGVGLGLGLALLLHLDPAELLGHHLQLPLALGVVAVVAKSAIKMGAET